MIGKAIYSKLTGDAAVAALLGTRVYPEQAPQDGRTFPLVVYAASDEEVVRSYAGSSGLESRNVTIECAARTYAQAQDLAAAVKAALDGADGVFGGVTVRGFFLEDQNDAVETNVAGEDFNVFVASQTYLVWYAPA
jgi:hypothetical protein